MSQLKKSTFLLAGALIGLSYFAGQYNGSGTTEESAAGEHADHAAPTGAPEIWTCSMHPQVRLPEAGKCPICFMDLILAASGDDDEDLGPRSLRMSETARALAEIETAKVERRAVARQVDMVGKVSFDETRVAYITSWVDGRLDRLFVDYTGVTVRKGDHLVEIYSPTLYSAQQELLQAITTAEKLADSSLEILRTTGNQTVKSSIEKLRLYGLSPEQIDEIVQKGEPSQHITVRAPIGGIVVHKNALEGMYVKEGTQIYTIADLSKVWVELEAYETDLAWLRFGQDVEFQVQAYPGESFHGRIAFIDPTLDDRTRTVSVRLNVDNSDERLKPEMFVSATAHAVLTKQGKVVDEDLASKWMCPMHPEVIRDSADACPECGMDLVPATELGFSASPEEGLSLVIPNTAALVTGKRAVVYVRLPDQEKPTFEGREIALGPRAGDWYVVYDGLEVGEDVVVKGNFKIDSELQIRAKPSMMNPAPPEPAGPPEPVVMEAPAAFRSQLGATLDAYIQLQAALANDKDDQTAADRIVDTLRAVEMSLLGGDAHLAWMDQQKGLIDAATKLAAATDLESRRQGLSPMTDSLSFALKTFGYESEKGEAGVFHCPMALDGDGANWLQLGSETSNPYYGSSMLRCGDQEETLTIGALMSAAGPMNHGGSDEFRQQIGNLLEAYLAVQASFAQDEDNPAQAKAMVASLEAVDMSLLSGQGHMTWMKQLPGLSKAAKDLAAATDLENRRILLSPLTGQLAGALQKFGYEIEGGQVGLFHCPMALDGDGADWIQLGEETTNPYYGESMLRCGSRKELLKEGK